MPMYKLKPMEWRFATEDNLEDIKSWSGNGRAELGKYYNEYGAWMDDDDFNEAWEEIG